MMLYFVVLLLKSFLQSLLLGDYEMLVIVLIYLFE